MVTVTLQTHRNDFKTQLFNALVQRACHAEGHSKRGAPVRVVIDAHESVCRQFRQIVLDVSLCSVMGMIAIDIHEIKEPVTERGRQLNRPSLMQENALAQMRLEKGVIEPG